MPVPLIEIKNLRVAYGVKTVLTDVNLTVYERDFLGIVGPNGGGKTTLVRCILGLLKPAAGEIVYHSGRDGAGVRRFAMGYLPQYSSIDRKFPITVEEAVLSGLSGRRKSAPSDKQQYCRPGQTALQDGWSSLYAASASQPDTCCCDAPKRCGQRGDSLWRICSFSHAGGRPGRWGSG